MPGMRWGWVGLRLQGETGITGYTSTALTMPIGLPNALADTENEGRVVSANLQTDAKAIARDWVFLAGPILRMPSQPLSTGYASTPRNKRRKLVNLCWVPPIVSVAAHYMRHVPTCDDVMRECGKEFEVGSAFDEAEDPLEMLDRYWDIGCINGFTDGSASHSGGGPTGWDDEGGMRRLYRTVDGEEQVSREWWDETAKAISSGHPVFLLTERLEAATVRHCTRTGSSYCHCLLVVGFEGRMVGAVGQPLSSDRRATSARGRATLPRLLVKDPCLAERVLEMAFESHHDVPVQCHVYTEGGRSGHDRFRLRGSAVMCGVQGAAVGGGTQLAPSSPPRSPRDTEKARGHSIFESLVE